jgi:hypothetical protein
VGGKRLKVYATESGKLLWEADVESRVAALAPGGKSALEVQWRSTFQGSRIFLRQGGKGKKARELVGKGYREDVLHMAFAPGGALAASGEEGGVVKLWNIASGRECGTLHHTPPGKCKRPEW